MPRTHQVSTARLIQRRDAWLKKLGELGPMNRLPDPRREDRCLYTQAHLLWLGLLLFLMHLGSRRQMRFERLAEAFMQNLAMPGQIRFQPP